MISVVIPVYNTYEYLPVCIESVLCQTCHNLEVILVDDGSTDGSGRLCDDYARKDNRVKVFHQENLGVAAARKQGVKAAEGEYLSFIDSDDHIEPDMLEVLVCLAVENEADIVTSGYISEYVQKNGSKKIDSVPVYDAFPEGRYDCRKKKWVCENLICYNKYSDWGILSSLGNKLIKKELVENNIDRIPESIAICEDGCLTYMCCMDADCIYVLHEAYYHYFMRETSCMHTPDRNCFAMLNECYHCLYQKVMETGTFQDALLHQLEMFAAREAIYCLNNRFGFSKGGALPLYAVSMQGWNLDTRLVLYGAGRVGESYYKQITALGQAVIVLWVDSDDRVVSANPLVRPVSAIQEETYDYILIAVKQEKMAGVIRSSLQKMGVEKHKIIWKESQFILDIYNT